MVQTLARNLPQDNPLVPLLARGSARVARPRLLTGDLHSDVLAFALLNYFPLHDRDASAIESEFGIPRQRAETFVGIRSAPSPIHVLFALEGAVSRFGSLDSWPSPFSFDGTFLRLHVPSHGFIFPVWRGHFRAWLHYRSAKDTSPKWISSSRLPHGSKAAASIHIAGPKLARELRACVLVSHALEAEAVAGGIVSAAAVNGLSPYAVARQLREMWPELRAVTLDLPEPGDLARALERAGLRVEVTM